MNENGDLEKVVRKTAGSGKLDFAPPVVLNETSKSRLQAMAWFIPHSDRTEFQLKLEGFKKSKDQPWVEDRLKTMTLTEEASRQLLKYLQTHLPVAEQSSAGEFILLRIAGGKVNLNDHNPKEVVAALTKVLCQEELVSHLAGTELSHELATALRGSIRLTEMRTAVAGLRAKLAQGEADEQIYQQWCEDHCWAFGNAYIIRDSVRDISAGDSLDLLLPGVFAGYRDIVELKRPDHKVLLHDAAHKNYYFSADVSKSIGQCHRYLDVLHETAKSGLLDHKEIVAYHPRATVVIGRSNDWSDDQQRALHGLNQRMHGIAVMTYDHLLAQGERLIDILGAAKEEKSSDEQEDDIPW